MNGIKVLVFILVFSFATTSCYNLQTQIVSLSCDKLNGNDTIWIRKDSLASIGYYFYGRGGSGVFFISNTSSDKPIFFDKKNSFISATNYKKDFWNDVAQLDGNLTIKQYRAINLKTQNPVNAKVTKAERIEMIAPNSILAFDPQVTLRNDLFNLSSYTYKTDTVKANWTNKKNKKTVVKSVSFSKQNSPASFRYFITLARTEDFKNPEYFDFNFWVSNIMEMNAKQATQSPAPVDYLEGMFNVNQVSDTDKFHPYKKSWRYYLTDIK
jgi:hypothetical protein